MIGMASMGPRVFTRGNHLSDADKATEVSASMGPRVFTRGNVSKITHRLARGNTVASMGPRVFTRGN